MLNRSGRILAAVLAALALIVGALSATSAAAPSAVELTPQQRAVAAGLPAGSAIYTPAEFAALPAGNGTSNFYMPKEGCWAYGPTGAGEATVASTNWDTGADQTYHVVINKPSWSTTFVDFYRDTVYRWSGTGEWYYKVPGHGSHRLGIRIRDGNWCAYYQ